MLNQSMKHILLKLIQMYSLFVVLEVCYFLLCLSIFLVNNDKDNGGDGLICARHLTFFGYKVTCVYPKRRNVAPFIVCNRYQ